MSDPLWPTLLQQAPGAPFFNLPVSVRRLHATRGTARYAGVASVERGVNPLARLCARLAAARPVSWTWLMQASWLGQMPARSGSQIYTIKAACKAER